MSPADRLRHIVMVLREEGSAESIEAARKIEDYLAGAAEGLTLDLALGCSPAPGQTPWWEAEARERRNAKLRKLRETHFGNLGLTAAARAIEQEARRYQATARQRGRREDAESDPRKRLLSEALETGLSMPKARQLIEILRSE